MTEAGPGCKGRGGNPRIKGRDESVGRPLRQCRGAPPTARIQCGHIWKPMQVIQRPTYLPRSVAEIDDFEVKTLRRQQHQRFRA